MSTVRKPARRGAKPAAPARRRFVTFMMYLSPAEKAGFKKCADLAGQSLAAWMIARLRPIAIAESKNEDLFKAPVE